MSMPGIILISESTLAHKITCSVFERLSDLHQPPEALELFLAPGETDSVEIRMVGKDRPTRSPLSGLDTQLSPYQSTDDPFAIACPLVIENFSEVEEHIRRIELIIENSSILKNLGISLFLIFPFGSPPTEEQRQILVSENSLQAYRTVFLVSDKDQHGRTVGWPDRVLESASQWIFGAFIAMLDGEATLPRLVWPGPYFGSTVQGRNFAAYGVRELILFPAKKIAERWAHKGIYDRLNGLVAEGKNEDKAVFAELKEKADRKVVDQYDSDKIVIHHGIPLPEKDLPWSKEMLDGWLQRYKSRCADSMDKTVAGWISSIRNAANPLRTATKKRVEDFKQSLVDFEVRLLSEIDSVSLMDFIDQLNRLKSETEEKNNERLLWEPLNPVLSKERDPQLDAAIDPCKERLEPHMLKRLLLIVLTVGVLPTLAGVMSLKLPLRHWLEGILPGVILEKIIFFQTGLIIVGFIAGALAVVYFVRRRNKIVADMWEKISTVLNGFEARYRSIASNLVTSGEIRRRRFINQILARRIQSWNHVIKHINPPADSRIEALGCNLSSLDKLGERFIQSTADSIRERWNSFVNRLNSGEDPDKSFERLITTAIQAEAIQKVRKQACLRDGMAHKAISNAGIDPNNIALNASFVAPQNIDGSILIAPSTFHNDLSNDPEYQHLNIVASAHLYDRLIFLRYLTNLPITAFRFKDN